MKFEIGEKKEKFNPVVVKMELTNSKELYAFKRSMEWLHRELHDDYGVTCFSLLAVALGETIDYKLKTGEMISVE